MNISPEKLLLVGMIALVVLGPNRLPQAARTAGKMLSEFRRVSASLQNEVSNAMAEPRDAVNQAAGEFGLGDIPKTLNGARTTLRSTLKDVVTGSSSGPSGVHAAEPVAVTGVDGPAATTADQSGPITGNHRAAISAPVGISPVGAPPVGSGASLDSSPTPDDPAFN